MDNEQDMQPESHRSKTSEAPSAGAVTQADQTAGDNVEPLFLADADALRAQTYRLLARLLREAPDVELLGQLAEPGADPEANNGSELAEAWSDLARASGEAEPETVDSEFHALFIGLGRGEVLPYASWYLSGFLLDKPLANIRSELQRLGIEREDNVSEPEDHAAALFETMALLLEPDSGFGHDEQKQFFDQHLRPWTAQFFSDLHRATSARYYRPVAKLGAAFIEFEQSWLSLPQ